MPFHTREPHGDRRGPVQFRRQFGKFPPAVAKVGLRVRVVRLDEVLSGQCPQGIVAAGRQFSQSFLPVARNQAFIASRNEIGVRVLRVFIELCLGIFVAAVHRHGTVDFLSAARMRALVLRSRTLPASTSASALRLAAISNCPALIAFCASRMPVGKHLMMSEPLAFFAISASTVALVDQASTA